MDNELRKHITSLRRSRALQYVVRWLYACALILYMVWFGLSATRIGEIPFLDIASSVFFDAMQGYFVFFLFCIFLLDAFVNRISVQKMTFGVIAVILVQSIIVNSGVQGSSESTYQYFAWLIIAYPRRFELSRAAKTIWITGGIIILVSAIVSFAGLLPDTVFFDLKGNARHLFGFTTVDIESTFTCSMVMCWVYSCSSSWNWRKALLASCLLFIILIASGALIDIVIAALQVAATCLMCQSGKWHWIAVDLSKTVCKLGVFLVPLLAVLSLVMFPVLDAVGPDPFGILDMLMGGTLLVSSLFFDASGYQLFGQSLAPYGSPLNSYLYVAMAGGLLCLFFLMVLYWRLGAFLERSGDVFMSLYVALLAIRMLSDPIMLLPAYNLAILAAGFYLAIGPDVRAFEREEARAQKEAMEASETQWQGSAVADDPGATRIFTAGAR